MGKRMSVLVVLVLSAALTAFMLTGCGGGAGNKEEAVEAFKQAWANSEDEVGDLNLEVKLDTSVTIQDTEALDIDGAVKMRYALPEGVTIPSGSPEEVIEAIDDLDLLIEMDLSMSAAGEETAATANVYATDGKIYLDLVSPETGQEGIRVCFEITPEVKEELLDSLDEESASWELGELEGAFKTLPVEDYVTEGSYGNGKIELTFDLLGFFEDLISSQSVFDADEESFDMDLAMLRQMVSDGNVHVTVTVSEDMRFTSMSISMETDVALSQASGSSGGDDRLRLRFDLDCPTCEVNTGAVVRLPSLEGYEDITDTMELADDDEISISLSA